MSGRDAAVLASTAVAAVVTVLLIAWWNWRLYVWLSEGGISPASPQSSFSVRLASF